MIKINHTEEEINQEILAQKAKKRKKIQIEEMKFMLEDAADIQEKYEKEKANTRNYSNPIKDEQLIDIYDL